MSRLRREVKLALEDGSRCGCATTAATCFEILKVEEGLWTFARVRGVEPTNNAVERALRHAVLWRRISGGTDSGRGGWGEGGGGGVGGGVGGWGAPLGGGGPKPSCFPAPGVWKPIVAVKLSP